MKLIHNVVVALVALAPPAPRRRRVRLSRLVEGSKDFRARGSEDRACQGTR